MKYKRRKFFAGECLHVYQRTIAGENIFYDREDYLVFYTLFSTISKLYNLTILELCIMVDHIHILISSDKLDYIASFMQHFTSKFVLIYNHEVGRKGNLLHKSYGSAPKVGNKKIRSTIVYIGNNPVEKSLCREASEYRWNFLAYIKESNPFSVKLAAKQIPPRVRSILNEIKKNQKANLYLSYAQLRRMFAKLSNSEKELVTDYIISTYYPFDTDALLSYYNSYEDMTYAMKSTAGSDYDIKEKFYYGSDTVYDEMSNFVENILQIKPVRLVTTLNDDAKFEVAKQLQKATMASTQQISKFLHFKSHKLGKWVRRFHFYSEA
jgi:REP element-mobilizing transposase RayT